LASARSKGSKRKAEEAEKDAFVLIGKFFELVLLVWGLG
jgi:hypothetical protein